MDAAEYEITSPALSRPRKVAGRSVDDPKEPLRRYARSL